MHLSIVKRTAGQAGLQVAEEKVQLGERLEVCWG